MRKAATIVDDRGESHVISWNFQSADQSRDYLVRRVQAEFKDSMGWGLNPRITRQSLIFMVGIGLAVIAGTIVTNAIGVTGVTAQLIAMSVMSCGSVFMVLIGSRSMRAIYQRATAISVEEGACGSCWYDLRATPVGADGMCVCPECRAAWRSGRIRTGADPLPAAREPESDEAKMIRRLGIFDSPYPIKDEHGRVFAVVSSRVLRQRAEMGERGSLGGDDSADRGLTVFCGRRRVHVARSNLERAECWDVMASVAALAHASVRRGLHDGSGCGSVASVGQR